MFDLNLFADVRKDKIERYTMDMDYHGFLRLVAECCETSAKKRELPRQKPVSVLQVSVFQTAQKDSVALNYDVFSADSSTLLLSVGILLRCPEKDREDILSQPHEDFLFLLSVLENGYVSTKVCAEKAVKLFKKNHIRFDAKNFDSMKE